MISKWIWIILILLFLNLLYLTNNGVYLISLHTRGALRINKYTGKSWTLLIRKDKPTWVPIEELE